MTASVDIERLFGGAGERRRCNAHFAVFRFGRARDRAFEILS